ncbi:hypothetical protein Tco_0924419 [Tanacetum coccineum]|uniref:RNA-directed DNA polymerase, eukaryota, reverse transcriptase zinc-binding domain protein n=1 Tax=Tanacetum coccineum TaxID=301880 RepID=A0ABQ5D571_9ASTR
MTSTTYRYRSSGVDNDKGMATSCNEEGKNGLEDEQLLGIGFFDLVEIILQRNKFLRIRISPLFDFSSFVAKSAFKKRDDTIRSKVYSNPKVDSKTNENSKGDKSYVGVVNNEKNSICNDSPSDVAFVIGDECLSAKAFSLALFGRVKEFASMANLKVAIGNEGFAEISIKYMGELWVMMEFQSVETLNKYILNLETVLDDAVLGNNQDEDANLVHPIDKSEDPFGLYTLLNKPKIFYRSDSNSGNSLKFPPGFTPPVDKEVANFEVMGNKPKCCAFETKSYKENVYDDVSCNKANLNNKDEEKVSSFSRHFKRSGCPRTDGSILGVLEEVVKVGQVMGYNMDGCISNMAKSLVPKRSGRKTKMESMDNSCVIKCWGNMVYDHGFSDVVGFCKLVEDSWKQPSIDSECYEEFRMGILKVLESIRSHFFNGHDISSKKVSWVNWNKVIASKDKGGLGVSSLYALNRGLLFKWIWRFLTQGSSLWAKVIKAIHGVDGNLGSNSKGGMKSCWSSIVTEVNALANKGIDLMQFLRIKIGNGDFIRLWEDPWHEGGILKLRYPRVYTLEMCKSITIGGKLAHPNLSDSFRRYPRGGAEFSQFGEFSALMHQVIRAPMADRWMWTRNSSGEFTVASVRQFIDDKICIGGGIIKLLGFDLFLIK